MAKLHPFLAIYTRLPPHSWMVRPEEGSNRETWNSGFNAYRIEAYGTLFSPQGFEPRYADPEFANGSAQSRDLVLSWTSQAFSWWLVTCQWKSKAKIISRRSTCRTAAACP